VRSHGVTVGLRVNRPELLGALVERLPAEARPARGPVVRLLYSLLVPRATAAHIRAFHLVYRGAERIARTTDLEQALDALEADVRLSVAAYAPRRIFVHAGVVAWQGRAILLPGRTFAGKSTLVEALVRAGATYYSDEYAVLDERGRVHPFPKAIALREPGTARARKVPVEQIGGTQGERPLAVGLVVATRYRAGARFRPRRLTPGQAVLELLDNTVPARRAPRRAMATLRAVALEAVAIRGTRGEAAELARDLLRRLEAAHERRGLEKQQVQC
jgi:hypothetical protein